MHKQKRPTDAARWYMNEASARVVAESGRADDRFHLGKLILRGLKDDPGLILQIDGGTGITETSGSVLQRSIQCANAFKELRLKCGDVIVLMATNNLDLCIPYYAALYLGVAITPVDKNLQIKELQDVFHKIEPTIIFCLSEKAKDVRSALDNCNVDSNIVTFDNKNKEINTSMCFKEFMEKGKNVVVSEFKATDFDPQETLAMLISTSGTTGLPKQAVLTHKNFVIPSTHMWSKFTEFPTPIKLAVIMSPLQWLSAIWIFNASAIFRFTRVQSSLEIDQKHAYHLINKYKPTFMISSPTLLATLIKPGDREQCDFSTIETMLVGGSAVSADLLDEMRRVSPNTDVYNVYGMSEINSLAFDWDVFPPGSSGKPALHLQFRLVDVDTKQDIVEPHQSGELWLKGPSVFKGYYKNPEATKETFTEDGWFKTGDLFYRDEHWNFFFVDRIKMLLKYRNHQISPVEIQNVILQHPGVLDAVVIGIPDLECGDLPVACVVRRPGYNVTEQELKDLVKESLTDSKQLRGGVIFLDAFPTTATTKVNCRKLKELAMDMKRD